MSITTIKHYLDNETLYHFELTCSYVRNERPSNTQLVLRKHKLWPLNQKLLKDQLYKLCAEDEKYAVKYLLSKYKFDDDVIYFGACIECCCHGHLKLLKYLLPFLNESYSSRFIKEAAISGHIKIVKYLCEKYHIAKEDIINNSNRDYYSSTEFIKRIVRNGHLNILKYFCEQFQLVKQDIINCENYMFDIIMMAIDHIEVVKYLISVFEITKEDISLLKDANRLKWFATNQEIPSVKYIIEKLNITKEELDIWKRLWDFDKIYREMKSSYDSYDSLMSKAESIIKTQSKKIRRQYWNIRCNDDNDEVYEEVKDFLLRLHLNIQFRPFRDYMYIRIDPEMNLFPPIATCKNKKSFS
jgi:hypothetical protein